MASSQSSLQPCSLYHEHVESSAYPADPVRKVFSFETEPKKNALFEDWGDQHTDVTYTYSVFGWIRWETGDEDIPEWVIGAWYTQTGKGFKDIKLTSWANQYDIECGEVLGWVFCKNNHRFPLDAHCDRQVCPLCWPRWMARETKNIERKLGQAMGENHLDPPGHYVVSFRDFPKDVEEYKKMRKQAVAKCKKLGLTAGCQIPHTREGENGLHFHICSFGAFRFDLVAKDYEQDSILVKYIRDIRDVEKLNDYELDHALKIETCQTVTWFGWLGNNACKTEIEIECKVAECPCCGEPLFEERIIFDNEKKEWIHNPPHMQRTENRKYTFLKQPHLAQNIIKGGFNNGIFV